VAKPHELLIDQGITRGGVTITRDGIILEDTGGYIVGGKYPTLVNPVTYGQVDNWLKSNPSEFYGSWLDMETGLLHIDAVDIVEDRYAAYGLAAERRELAIWDVANGREIRL
jgi:hypothetical protein